MTPGADKEIFDELRGRTGAMISGRRLYGITSGWHGSQSVRRREGRRFRRLALGHWDTLTYSREDRYMKHTSVSRLADHVG